MNSSELPNGSGYSLIKGIWFVFDYKENSVVIFCSSFGKEEIFLNNQLISQGRNMNRKSTHNFKDPDGIEYTVQLDLINMFKWQIKCTVHRENVLIKTFTTKRKRGRNFLFKRFLFVFLSTFFFGMASHYFNWPQTAFYLFMALVILIQIVTYDAGQMNIEEE
ncbi:MAG: hypothetical protein AAF487_13880 [Bacteroidota bacterium]